MLVSIVIPCYNSEHTIEEVVDKCMEEFDKTEDYECEMILVNDFSKDGTFDAIKRAASKYSNVTGISLAKNFGQHGAIMAGLHYVSGELVIGMDDDMQNHPSQIKNFLEKEKEGWDVIFGVYKKRKFGFLKNITSGIATFLMRHLLERPKGIESGNFWLAKRYVIEKIKEYEGSDAYIQLLFYRTTHNMTNIEIEHYEREEGRSNYTFGKGLKLFLSVMDYSILPLRLSTLFGSLFSAVGLIAAIAVFVRKLIDPSITVGWSSLMCAMLILFGFVFLMLGILGEYLGKSLLTISKTPQYVIRDVVGEKEKEKTEKS